MYTYKLKSDLAQKIEYLRDRVAEIKQDSAALQRKIEHNDKVLACIEKNFSKLASSKFEPERPWKQNL